MIYLNSAGIGLMPTATRTRLREVSDRLLAFGSAHFFEIHEQIEASRRQIAQLLDCDADEIAFANNTSSALLSIANGLAISPGDEIVVFENDFPANVTPWQALTARGAVLRWVPMSDGGYDLTELTRVISEKTRLVAVSHVNFMTGFRIDVTALCRIAHAHGAFVCLDAIQSAGAIPLSLKDIPVDFLAAGGHKWLRGPLGSGVLFVRRKNLAIVSHGPHGWLAYDGAVDFLFQGEGLLSYRRDLKPSARRFEHGVPSPLPAIALGESVRALTDAGLPLVHEAIRHNVKRLRREIAALGYRILTPEQAEPSGILCFQHPSKNNRDIFEALLKKDVHIAFPDGKLRVSPHFDATENDIAGFLRALADLQI